MYLKQDISIVRGDDATFSLVLSNGSAPINISGSVFFFTVKATDVNDANDTAALIQKTWATHTDAVNGKTDLILTNTDTAIAPGVYFYDIQVKDGANKITTIFKGFCTIVNDQTKRTS